MPSIWNCSRRKNPLAMVSCGGISCVEGSKKSTMKSSMLFFGPRYALVSVLSYLGSSGMKITV
jgi:hypothetical protein